PPWLARRLRRRAAPPGGLPPGPCPASSSPPRRGQGGIRSRRQARAPAAASRIGRVVAPPGYAVGSWRASRALEQAADDGRYALPVLLFDDQPLLAGSRDRVVLGLSVVLREAPPGGRPSYLPAGR